MPALLGKDSPQGLNDWFKIEGLKRVNHFRGRE